MFTAVLNILSFTLPSNVTCIADYLANANQFLDHPLPYYIPENHFDSPIYYNPHNPPVEGFRAMRKNRLDAMMGRGAMQQQQQKTIDIQRDQVDQVFMALPSHDDLPETDPGEMIKTKLFPHQLKAITFLQQRENESAAIKAASAAPKEDIEIVDVDAEMSEDEKKKQIKRIKKKAEKDAKKKGVNSLWLPQYDGSGKKIKAWKHLVTDETVKSKEKPVEARGAILADEVSLTIEMAYGRAKTEADRLVWNDANLLDGSRKDPVDRQLDRFDPSECKEIRTRLGQGRTDRLGWLERSRRRCRRSRCLPFRGVRVWHAF